MGAQPTNVLPEASSPAPKRMFPQWRDVEQDFWFDMFEQFSETILNQIPEDEDELKKQIRQAGEAVGAGADWEESRRIFYTDKIKLAAVLADEATKEMIYRFERQKPIPKQRRPVSGGGDDKPKKKRRALW